MASRLVEWGGGEDILVLGSALKRWISEADIEHALAFAMVSYDNDEDGSIIAIGPAIDGSLIEVGYRAKWGIRFVVFHAMEAREKFLQREGDEDADR